MNPRRTPFLRLFWPFSTGLLLGGIYDCPIPGLSYLIFFLSIALIFLGLLSFRYKLRWLFGAWTFALLFLFGYQYMVQHNEMQQPDHFAAQRSEIRYVLGVVYDAPVAGKKIKIPIRVEGIGSGPDSMHISSGNILLLADTNACLPRYGDRIFVRTTILETEGPKNPHAFDYKRYLHFQNIHHQAFVKSDSLQILSSGNGYALWQGAFYCREKVLSLLQRYFPGTDEYAVAGALLLGYKDELSEDMRTAYAETGSMHALAVSGSHVSMLYVGLLFLISRFRRFIRKAWMETLLILAAIWAFTFITGATASVLRASAMFSTYMLGRLLQKEPLAWNILPASACMLLSFNPYLLFDAGFQLSYAAVCGMIYFYPYLNKAFPEPKAWLAREMRGVFLVGVAAQLGTLPLTLYYFNQFPIYFWLAGWVVVFGGAVFLWGGVLLIALDACFPTLAALLGSALNAMIWGMNKLVFAIHAIPGGVIKGLWIPVGVLVLLYACILFLGKMLESRRGYWLVAFFSGICLWACYQDLHLISKSRQEKLVVYCVPKKRFIDFFAGRNVYSLADSMESKQLQFAGMTNRYAEGMLGNARSIPSDSVLEFSHLSVQKPFIQFFEKRIILLDDARCLDTQVSAYPADLLIVSHSPNVELRKALAVFPVPMVVFDASNSRKKVAAWKQECATMGIAFHDVREDGAFEY